MIDKLLLGHVGLPQVLDLAVHLVNFFGWMSQGGFLLKSYGWDGEVAHVIFVSAFGPNPSFFYFFGTFIPLGGLLGQGLGLVLKTRA